MSQFSRRTFMQLSALAGLTKLIGCSGIDPVAGGGGAIAYRRSGRGRRISRAAKKHNANRLYATAAAANGDRPHAGDSSKVVAVTIPQNKFDRLFTGGRKSADLRRMM
ncbi:MAG: hypothetical protein O7D91_21300 [Planctomycetota bacterium]|nr:hypothetical protein [Planctomycetota bacterium]